MMTPILLRADLNGFGLRRLARETQDANPARRLPALAAIDEGGSRTDAAGIGSVTLQIVRDRVMQFNERGATGLINLKAPSSPSRLNEEKRQTLAKIVKSGPIPAVHGVLRWRRKDVVQWMYEKCAISLDETTIGRELKVMGGRSATSPAKLAVAAQDLVDTLLLGTQRLFRRLARKPHGRQLGDHDVLDRALIMNLRESMRDGRRFRVFAAMRKILERLGSDNRLAHRQVACPGPLKVVVVDELQERDRSVRHLG